MKAKKIIAIGLVTVMLAWTLCGCGDSTTSNKNNGDASMEQKGEAGFTEHIYDMGGKTITIADSSLMEAEAPTPQKEAVLEALNAIEKDYNCEIKVIPVDGNTVQNFTTSLAGGKIYANIINAQSPELGKLIETGNIAEVHTIKNLGMDTNAWTEVGKLRTEFKPGEQYGVNFIESHRSSINWTVLTFNMDLAAEYGIEDMYELVRNNEWTYEKFEEICQTITQKSGGKIKGLIHGYPIFQTCILTNGAETYTYKDGKYVYNGLSDNVLEGLQFLYDFNKKGLLDMENYKGTDYGLSEANVFMDRNTLFHISDYWVVNEVLSMGMPDDYGVLPLPVGPSGSEIVGVASNCRSYCFVKGDPDIEDAAAVLVALANRTALTPKEWAEQELEVTLRDDDSAGMLEIMMKNTTTLDQLSRLGGDWYQAVIKCVYDMSLTPRQAMEQTQQNAQAALDEYYGQ